jgi:cupin fold WbuC family metalloprotein
MSGAVLRDALGVLAEEAPGVYYAAEPVVVSAATIAFLKERAAANPRRRSALCTHPSSAAAQHDMLMVQHRSCYGRPHRHIGRSEAFHVIEGEVVLAIHDAAGAVIDAVRMSSPASGLPFYYRIPAETIHGSLIRSEWLVLHETTLGPFDRRTTAFPDWAPDGSEPEATAAFVRSTAGAVDAILAARSA